MVTEPIGVPDDVVLILADRNLSSKTGFISPILKRVGKILELTSIG
jgi:hypothetical protein